MFKQQVNLVDPMAEVCEVKATINQKDQIIERLKERGEDSEQRSRSNYTVLL